MTRHISYECNLCKTKDLKAEDVKGVGYDAPPYDERRSVMFFPPKDTDYHICLKCIPKAKLTR